jgi:hypothetical protein
MSVHDSIKVTRKRWCDYSYIYTYYSNGKNSILDHHDIGRQWYKN